MKVSRGTCNGNLGRWRSLGVAQCARCSEPYLYEGDTEFGEFCRPCLDYIFEQARMAPVVEMMQ